MKNWSVVFVAATDYEAELVCNRLRDQDIAAVVLSQRDHAWNLNCGYLAKVRVFVPDDQAGPALEILGQRVSAEELASHALAAREDGDLEGGRNQ